MRFSELRFVVLVIFILSLVPCKGTAQGTASQGYLSAVGSPNFALNLPVPNGYINVANGNLHLEFPLSTLQQRGILKLNERLVYDSRIWEIIAYNHHYWWPLNITGADLTTQASDGWRFVTGGETGLVSYRYASQSSVDCSDQYGNDSSDDTYSSAITWTDPGGVAHTFDALQQSEDNNCTNTYTQSITGGYASDASGYSVADDGTGNPLITDISGTQVYPKIADRYGNFWSSDSNGNLIDDLGRTPVIKTVNGNTTYYDILAPNGPITNNGTRVRYTVNYESISLTTNFNQQAVSEYQQNGHPAGSNHPNILTVQSIQLPDGTSYQFGYDSYGSINSVTLPQSGNVAYGWTNYQDSYQNVNHWLATSTTTDGTTSLTPSLISQCSSNGTGCQEAVNVHRPSGDETNYTFTLNNGAWDTNTTIYSGPASANTPVFTDATTYNFSNSCIYTQACSGSQYITKATEVQTLPDAGLATTIQTGYSNPESGRLTSFAQWDYYPTSGSAPPNPTRSSTYAFTGYDLTSETHYDQVGNVASNVSYVFTNNATPTSNVIGHGTANAGGPYLTSIVNQSNSPTTTSTIQNTYDDTGALLSVQDAKGNPPTSYKYDPTDTFVVEIDRPDTSNTLGTFHHVTKASYDPSTGAVLSADDENSVAHSQAYTVHYTYEAVEGRMASITYPFDPATSSVGGSVTYTYPSPNEIDTTVAQTATTSILTQSFSDAYGRLSSTTTAGNSTKTTYDGNGRPYQTYTAFGGSQSATDGVTTTFYDALSRVTKVINADNTQHATSYVGNVATATDELGHQKQLTYDAFGDVSSVTEADPVSGSLSLVTNYFFDGLGNTVCVEQHGSVSGSGCSSSPSSDPGSPWRIRRFFYNSLGQLRAASIPEHTSSSHPGQNNCSTPENGSYWTDCYVYDASGNLAVKTDNLQASTTFNYDSLNRLTKELGSSISDVFTYDYGTNGTNHLYMQSNNGTAVSAYSYDIAGRVTSTTSCAPSNCPRSVRGSTPSPTTFKGPAYPTTYAAYDLAGNLTDLTYPDTRVIHNAYDGSNRLNAVTYAQWGGQPVGTTYWSSPAYAPPGQLTAATLGNGVTEQAQFNSRLNLTSLSYSAPSATQPFISKAYQWDRNASNLTLETNNVSGQFRQFTYDNLNRLSAAADVSSIATPASGNASISGVEGTQQGDCPGGDGLQQSQPSNTSSAQPDQAPPRCPIIYDTGAISISVGSFTASVNYGRGSNPSNLATKLSAQLNMALSPVQASVSGSTLSLTSIATGAAANYSLSTTSDGDFTATFGSGQPGASSALSGGQAGTPTAGGLNQQYGIDAWGNIGQLGGSSGGFSQAISNQNQVASFGYDGKGRLTNDGLLGYVYNGDDLLTSSSDGVYYTYDGARQRVAVANSSSTIEFYYFAGTLVAARSLANSSWTDLIYATGRRIAEVSGTQAAIPSYGLLDQIGSEIATTDNNGQITNTQDYSPFGQLVSGSVPPDGYAFAELARDGSSGLDHADARQYSSNTGRWTVPDPFDGSYSASNPQSLNRYVYLGDRPLGGTDPSGLFFEDPVFQLIVSSQETTVYADAYPWVDIGLAALFIGDVAYELLDGGLFEPKFVGNVQAQKKGKLSRNLRRLREVNECASKLANKFSIAGVLNINEEAHPILASITNAFLGNTFSGISDTITHIATGNIPTAYGDYALGGTRQGLPGGTASSKGLAGVITETTVNALTRPASILSGVTGVATELGEEGLAGPVGIAKLAIDGGVYAGSLLYCNAHIP